MGIAVYYNCCCDNIIIQYKLNSYNGLSKFNYNSIRLAKQYFLTRILNIANRSCVSGSAAQMYVMNQERSLEMALFDRPYTLTDGEGASCLLPKNPTPRYLPFGPQTAKLQWPPSSFFAHWSEVIFKVIQGQWYWRLSIGRVYDTISFLI